jgi:tRNA threonylcarbamoyladenosine biosynthesis protein TsaE
VATITSLSPEETFAFGASLAADLRGGEIFALCGDLGAGKTHLAKGLAGGLGCDPAAVTSPTFTLVHEYPGGRLPVFHFDFYRLEDEDEVWRLGFEEYLGERGVLLVEWADKFPQAMPAATRWLDLRSGAGDERIITERA